MVAHGLAATQDPPGDILPRFDDPPPFNAAEFDELAEMIGDDGVMEMVMIFEAETRHRLLRLQAGGQDLATQLREMHTLKGAAGTVAAPCLAALGRTFEQAAYEGSAPSTADIGMIATALEAWLSAVRASRMQEMPAG
jgi:HPt (histidine-containing phosphotransfer) domain-containing protein